jgi:hypothetical protein
MTRSTPLRQTVRGQTRRRAGVRAVSPPASKFVSFEENGGAFHWAIIAAGGDRLIPSATFASYEQATQAAGVVRTGAVPAPFDKQADDPAPRARRPPGEGDRCRRAERRALAG